MKLNGIKQNNFVTHGGVCRVVLIVCALVVIIIAFLGINRCGFFVSDDYSMGEDGYHSFRDVIVGTKSFYLNWGGGLFSAFSQFLFCGWLSFDKLWFDIANTIKFACMLLVCSRLIGDGKREESATINILLFALLFWFLCPAPRETLFWAVGSMGYLWPTTLVFLFLVCFMQNMDANSSKWVKLLMFFFGVFTAASIIPCVSVCGAFVVYYLLHLKEFKGNAVFLVVGFVVGTLILMLAPGNFARASEELFSFIDKIKDLVAHPVRELLKYRGLWLFAFVWLLALKLNKRVALSWARKNVFFIDGAWLEHYCF